MIHRVIHRVKEISKLLGLKKILDRSPMLKGVFYKILWLLAPRKPRVVNTKYGFKLLIIPRDRGIGFPLWIGHEFEPETVKIFQKFISPGDIVFDVGANIGYFTMLASQLVGKQGKVVSFEPVPYLIELLKSSANLNRFQNILPLQIALSNKQGEGVIYTDIENYGLASSVRKNIIKMGREIKVRFTTLDNFVKENYILPDFMKIDVQGFEFEVLQGAIRTLKESPKVKLYFEFWPRGIRNAGYEPQEVFDLLDALRFKVFDVTQGGELFLLSRDKFLHLTNELLLSKNFLASTNLFAVR